MIIWLVIFYLMISLGAGLRYALDANLMYFKKHPEKQQYFSFCLAFNFVVFFIIWPFMLGASILDLRRKS